MSFHGHFWTIAPVVRHAFGAPRLGAATPWSTTVPDDSRDVTLTGSLHDVPGDRLVILVHGLGGSPDAHYVMRAAKTIADAGVSYLRMAVRGADRSGADMYHAGLTADLHAALRSPDLARYESVALLGFSMGGHVSLRWAYEGGDPRVKAVAAVCPPLDLGATATAIDKAGFNYYRTHLLRGLKEIYAAAHQRAPMPTPLDRVKAIKRIREWDELTVVPRFGFPDVDTYYQSQSAGPVLGAIQVPSLVVAMRDDPMIPIETSRAFFDRASSAVTCLESAKGGHVGWPGGVDLGLASGTGVDRQVVGWLLDRL